MHGEQLSYIIDDAMGITADEHTGQFHGGTVIMLLTALGFTFSLPKCSLPPSQVALFRGMQIDSRLGLCSVPEDKLQFFMQKARELLSKPRLAAKAIASVAGMLVSFQPAMPYAMMQARAYFEAIQGQSWGSMAVQLTTAVRQDMAWWLPRMEEGNGRGLWYRASSTIIASDASASRYAAHVVQGQPEGFIFQLDFTPEELQQTADHQLGSTLRELIAILRCIRTLLQHHPQHVQHAQLQWLSDSQSGVADLTHMRASTPALLGVVRQICQTAVEHDIAFDWQWRPRDTPELALADYYSKEVDTGMHMPAVSAWC